MITGFLSFRSVMAKQICVRVNALPFMSFVWWHKTKRSAWSKLLTQFAVPQHELASELKFHYIKELTTSQHQIDLQWQWQWQRRQYISRASIFLSALYGKRLFMFQSSRRKFHYVASTKDFSFVSFGTAKSCITYLGCCWKSKLWANVRRGGKWIGHLHIFVPSTKALEWSHSERECFRSDILWDHKSCKSQRRTQLIEIQQNIHTDGVARLQRNPIYWFKNFAKYFFA